ncbi:PREDICTED: uncharacterized protein LOC109235317 isoform X1 [Nicotiana attenuata]|uniref:Uncharacterized protein n=2 Tax=Nicotiana attenuata TaxID=49451 RepID=A0A1J6IL39_NICAT|nr:PREDICTED: uncharacterized protein LOC109235317 isoform X1 [Nicotiana attenuata]XP_019256923.1 PREDICTED: uncharacterized protein LOC109235317 isoform X1 [Nicotiana attenuata]XP_019256924.1 PREDICTED: uncharacterized protein LOC109235317 isoform X1 [Nicotiana attenuata]XP_019256925.1 PREDICTED: uncharacterized protein LOC109235317 isoform X1 [Nicotiana attenuata]OIS95872.1 hypothetical protein A4A49_34480 [Nicotiana attenuata]
MQTMKSDNHPLFCDSNLVSVHDSKTFECNNSVLDTAEEKPTMKGNQNGILSHSNGYEEEDSLGFPTKDFANTNVHGHSEDPLARDTEDGNEFWKVPELGDSIFFDNNNEIKASSVRDDQNADMSKVIADKRGGNPFACDFPLSNTNEIDVASVTDDQNGGLSNIIHSKRGGNPFECDTKDRDQPWNIPEYECSMIVDFLDHKENKTIDSDSPFTSHSELFENNTNLYSDKGVTDHDLPELTVCYRESNFNIVKDICMDEGVPAVDKVLIESWKDDQPSTSVSVGADEDQQSNTRESVDEGSLSSSVLKDSSVEDAKNVVVSHDIEQEQATVPNGFNPSAEDNANKNADKDSYLEDLMMIFGSKCSANGKATSATEKASSPNNVVRLEESKVNNSQKANSDGDHSALQPDQMPSEQATLKSQTAAVSAADETNNSGPASNLFHNSKKETGASIFDFNSTKPDSNKSKEKGVENLPEDSLMSKVIAVHKDGNYDGLSAASQAHNSVDNTADIVHQKSQNGANPEDKLSDNFPPGDQGHFADGEASFSVIPASGSISYSGPISYSGSISLRSDASTTSARSFAFPVLQNEWNSSPIRMAKAERRRLRKQKGWRQGLLCCRF